MKDIRHYNLVDKLCITLDNAVRALQDAPTLSGEPYPAETASNPALSEAERKQAAGLMRVNHAGEICAQALYHGQALASKNSKLQLQLAKAAVEEGDHLSWCKTRLVELDSHVSYLNPLWYAGSFCIGLAAGMIGDKWSLGFVAETERQVGDHLKKHMQLLPPEDVRSYKILNKMADDEAKHREEAIQNGAYVLPKPVKSIMSLTSKIMVKLAYWV